jgi:hypothetical protein
LAENLNLNPSLDFGVVSEGTTRLIHKGKPSSGWSLGKEIGEAAVAAEKLTLPGGVVSTSISAAMVLIG